MAGSAACGHSARSSHPLGPLGRVEKRDFVSPAGRVLRVASPTPVRRLWRGLEGACSVCVESSRAVKRDPFSYSLNGICMCVALAERGVTLNLVLGSVWSGQDFPRGPGAWGSGPGPAGQTGRAEAEKPLECRRSTRSLISPQARERRAGSRARGRGRPCPPQGRRGPCAAPLSGSPKPQRCPGLDSRAGGRAGDCRPLLGAELGQRLGQRCVQQVRECKSGPFRLCPPWQHFDTDTQDLAGIEWAPNGCVLAVWDTCLEVRRCFPAFP